MVRFQQLKLLLVLGTVFAAPTFIIAAEAEKEALDKSLFVSPLRQASRAAWFQQQCEVAPGEEAPTPEEQQAVARAYHAMGLLTGCFQPPAKQYNFLAPYVSVLQSHLASTALGAEAIINVLENPEKQALVERFVQKFMQNPDSIAAYQEHVHELEQACGKELEPEHAAALLDATTSADQTVVDRTQNYNSKRRYCLERLKQGSKFVCSTGVPWAMSMLVPGAMQTCLSVYGVPGIASYFLSSKLLNNELLPYPIGSMIGVGTMLKSRDYSLWKALPAGVALGAAHATAAAHGLFKQNKFFDTRAGLKAAIKLAPYLYPFGLSKEIHEHAPWTIENVQHALASLEAAGYMDVALHIAKLLHEHRAISCVPAAASEYTLSTALQQLWQASAPGEEGLDTLFPVVKTQTEENTFAIEKHSNCSQHELFDLFILNAITAQTFKIALNITGCPLTQLALPALNDMQFFAIHHYRDNTENMVMHRVQVKI